MLKKEHITRITIYSDLWFSERLGMFTASDNFKLMGEKWPSDGALSYVYEKVGEELSGVSAGKTIETEATIHGTQYEPEAIELFKKSADYEYITVQNMVSVPHTRFSCTPDFIIPVSVTDEGYRVKTGEVKCPLNHDRYIELALCKTPEELKKVSKKYYWQVLFQMDTCDAMDGIFLCYNPFFRTGKMNIIEFRKALLLNDFKLIKERKAKAIELFEDVRERLMNLNH
jgi:hypothetical protein